MLQYVLAGLALGSIYAIASAGLVVTFVSTGVLNFAFGSMAYVVARFYYWLNTQHGWTTWSAGFVSLLVMAPLLGVVLYAVLFRFVRNRSSLIKIVVTIGLSVALPPIADLVFGTQTVTTAPGLALSSDQPYHFLGSAGDHRPDHHLWLRSPGRLGRNGRPPVHQGRPARESNRGLGGHDLHVRLESRTGGRRRLGP